MGEQEQLVNTGEQVSNTPTGIALTPEAQFRNLNSRLDKLTDEISRIAKPPVFRFADLLQMAIIAIGIAVALITAFGLNERINDLSKGQAATEERVSASLTGSEGRLSARLDKLSDQFTKVDERTSTLEGQRSAKNQNSR